MITMFDAIDTSQIPSNAQAVAGYAGGNWPTFASLAAKFPNAYRLSIAVNSGEDADCLDVEPGDATVGDTPGWYARQRARGVARPCLYASAGIMNDLLGTLQQAGISRPSVRLWSAHYSGQHICAPGSCGMTSTPMDGTQWTSTALGRSLDESLLVDGFFGSTPSPSWQETMMDALPTLKQGASDVSGQPLAVHRVQLLVGGIGKWNNLGAVTQIAQDGSFGPATTAGVKKVQQFFGLTQDGIVGPASWSALVTGSA